MGHAAIRFARVLIGAVFLLSSAVQGKDWPTQAVKIVLPYPPGGASDVTARMLGAELGSVWNVPVVIENRPGANGIVANEYVAKAPPDGHTILMANLGPNAINHAVYAKLPYDTLRDFAPVILTTKVPLVLVTGADSPFKSLAQLVAHARSHSGELSYGSAGAGASSHMAGELLSAMAQVKFLHVPYKGDAPALTDLMGGQVAFALPTALAAMPHLKSGRVKALAVTSEARLASLPDVPTVSEALGLPDYAATSWGGFMVPIGTPDKVVRKLNADFGALLGNETIRRKLEEQGAVTVGGSPEDFGLFLREELVKWKRVAQQANIQLE